MSEYFNIPEIAYCRVDRAARLIGCEIEDLYHWMETDVIKGCINVMYENQSNADIFVYGDIEHATEYLKNIDWGGGYFPFSKYSVSTLDIALMGSEPYPLTETSDEYTFFYGVICGVWVIDSGLQYLFSDEETIEVRRLKPCCIDHEKHDFTHATCEMNIKKSDLWVLKDDLEKLAGKQFRELEQGYESAIKKKIKAEERFTENRTKTNNARAQFIKSLLHIHYGSDVAESPRRFMENKDSEISNDFKNQGIIPPSGKAVQDWLKFTEIPFKSQE
ncbi:hypothetical protein [Morganella morganii]|nr:hypothetical protein [Morganella morganii]